MTIQQLSDRCVELGAALTPAVITNLELGRREGTGRRRVTVEELLIFATALDVPPVLLFLPLDGRTELEIGPGHTMSSWKALFWLAGESEPGDQAKRSLWRQTIGPVSLHRDFRKCFEEAARLEVRTFRDDSDETDVEYLAGFEGRLKELAKIAEWMLDSDITPPDIPRTWMEIMRERGWLKRPDEIRVQESE